MTDDESPMVADANNHADVHAAKIAVMKEVLGVAKTGRMTGAQQYSYMTVEELIGQLRPAMLRHDLCFAPVAMHIDKLEVYRTKNDVAMNHIILTATHRLTHAASKTSEDIVTIGEAADSGDKCANKAMTVRIGFKTSQS